MPQNFNYRKRVSREAVELARLASGLRVSAELLDLGNSNNLRDLRHQFEVVSLKRDALNALIDGYYQSYEDHNARSSYVQESIEATTRAPELTELFKKTSEDIACTKGILDRVPKGSDGASRPVQIWIPRTTLDKALS